MHPFLIDGTPIRGWEVLLFPCLHAVSGAIHKVACSLKRSSTVMRSAGSLSLKRTLPFITVLVQKT
jgi:hypothetical protein